MIDWEKGAFLSSWWMTWSCHHSIPAMPVHRIQKWPCTRLVLWLHAFKLKGFVLWSSAFFIGHSSDTYGARDWHQHCFSCFSPPVFQGSKHNGHGNSLLINRVGVWSNSAFKYNRPDVSGGVASFCLRFDPCYLHMVSGKFQVLLMLNLCAYSIV